MDVCDYIIDLDLPHQLEPHYNNSPDWQVLVAWPFLDAENSSSPFYRAFYVPGKSELHNSFGQYCLLKRRVHNKV